MRSQGYIEDISKWTKNQQMVISEKKTKSMIINFTEKYQYHTRLKLNECNIRVVEKRKYWVHWLLTSFLGANIVIFCQKK